MKFSKKTLSCLLLSSVLPATAFADITFTNNTTSSQVSFFYKHWCSNIVDGGVIQPNGGRYTLDQFTIDNNCFKECLVDVFTSDNCSENTKIARAKISSKEGGISNIANFSSNHIVEGSGSAASIREATGGNSWFGKFFG